MYRKLILVPLVLLMTVACAVRSSHAPQLTPQTVWELNTVDQLSQLERDYRQLFKDVGNWRRAGQLTSDQVSQLNIVGNHMKTSLETANRLFKTWQRVRDENSRVQVVTAVAAASDAFVTLMLKKTQVVTGGKP